MSTKNIVHFILNPEVHFFCIFSQNCFVKISLHSSYQTKYRDLCLFCWVKFCKSMHLTKKLTSEFCVYKLDSPLSTLPHVTPECIWTVHCLCHCQIPDVDIGSYPHPRPGRHVRYRVRCSQSHRKGTHMGLHTLPVGQHGKLVSILRLCIFGVV